MKGFNVYMGLFVCIELYLIYILEKLHEQTPNLWVMQGHYNIIRILLLFFSISLVYSQSNSSAACFPISPTFSILK